MHEKYYTHISARHVMPTIHIGHSFYQLLVLSDDCFKTSFFFLLGTVLTQFHMTVLMSARCTLGLLFTHESSYCFSAF